MLAAANALDANTALVAGSTLKAPQVTTSSNNASTFKPYNPADITGPTTPALPHIPPPPSSGCGTLGLIIMIAITIIVTVYTAGAASLIASQGATAAASASASTIMGAGVGVVTGASGFTVATMSAAFEGGFVGSVAGQVTGDALGVHHGFSITDALAAGLTTAASAGIGNAINGGQSVSQLLKASTIASYGRIAATAVADNLAGYAANKLVGNHVAFSWKSLAATAVASVLSTGISKGLTLTTDNFVDNLANGLIGGAINAEAQHAIAGGPKPNWSNITADAFGNAIANGVENAVIGAGKPNGGFFGPSSGNSAREDAINADRAQYQNAEAIKAAEQLDPARKQAYDMMVKSNLSPSQAIGLVNILSKDALDAGNKILDWGSGTGGVTTRLPDVQRLTPDELSAYMKVLALGKEGEAASDVAAFVAIREQIDADWARVSGAPISDPQRARMEDIRFVFANALLSKDAYFDGSGISELMPSGFHRIDNNDAVALANLGVTPQMLNHNGDGGSGYYAAIYNYGADDGSTHYIIANRGTELTDANGKTDYRDAAADYIQGTGHVGDQYREAMDVALAVQQATYGFVSFTGHSLGGGLASAQAIRTGLHAITFNAAGLDPATVAAYRSNYAHRDQLITEYYDSGEFLDFMQDRGKYGAAVLVAGLPSTEALPAKLKFIQMLVDMPAAVGTRYGLDSVTPSGWDSGKLVPGTPMSESDFLGTGQLDVRLNLHSMSSVMNSLIVTYNANTWDHFPGVRH